MTLFIDVFIADINFQMAKRMRYSVVGLPHYVIWHLYEPSVDDIRHMEVRLSSLIVFFCTLTNTILGDGTRKDCS